MSKEISILMIDDDEEDFMITRSQLNEVTNRKYRIEWESNYDNALKLINERKHDIYFVDFRLGKNNGLELIQESIEHGCEAPLILLTSQGDIEIDEKAMKAGASDFLVKGVTTASQFESSIRYCIEHAKNIKVIKDLNTKLEKRVKDRTMILEEALRELETSRAELSIALNKERDLNELKSRFVAMASHEFRTPLATILSSLSLIAKYVENGDKEKQDKHIQRIKNSVTHMTDILNDVLSISKLEEGKVLPVISDINLQEFLHQMKQELVQLVKQGQKINYTHTGETKIVSLDKGILKNIIFNLVSNAIKFSPEDKNIDISSNISGDTISISITDEGIGISADDQKHLFERFFRGYNAINIQGTGLGLSIVAKYIEMLNGSIEVKSKLGTGTSFNIKLPVHYISEDSE